MKFNRRAFMTVATIAGSTFLEKSWSGNIWGYSRLSILQGVTNETMTEMTIVFPSWMRLDVYAANSKGEKIFPCEAEVINLIPNSENIILKICFEGLSVKDQYQLFVENGNGHIVDQRNFKTLDLNKKNPKIAVLSCMNDFLHRYRIWGSLFSDKPDVIFFVGDSVYADFKSFGEKKRATPKQLWNRFSEARNKLFVYFQPTLTPILAIWDDHDFGLNNADSTYPYVPETQKNFLSFFAQSDSNPSLERGPGIAFKWSAFGKSFYFLDGRSFRSSRHEKHETVFGEDQEEWLFDHLNQDQSPAWLITGSQWFGGYIKGEGYERTHPKSFKGFLERLKKNQSQIQFISGDVHFSEVMAIEESLLGYPTFEFTCSSMHSLTFPGWHKVTSNPRRLEAASSHNYCLFDLNESSISFSGTIQSKNIRGQPLFSQIF